MLYCFFDDKAEPEYANKIYKMIRGRGQVFKSLRYVENPILAATTRPYPIKTLEIFSSDTVFIYSDFVVTDPEFSLSIMAPKWWIVGARKSNLLVTVVKRLLYQIRFTYLDWRKVLPTDGI
jgi:hypothetical protein